ncbi:hypothetical protein WJX79_000820 [Trebouxia sp. C0005]
MFLTWAKALPHQRAGGEGEEETTSPVSPAAHPSKEGAFIGRRVTVRWEQEEEDFEGFIKRFRPDSTYCYEVAYDDGDEEWGWFSATHFHTDEVQRRFTWLQEQDEQEPSRASQLSREGSLRHKVSPSAAAKLQLETAAAVPPEAPTTGPSELEDLDAEDIQADSVSPGDRQCKQLEADAEDLQQERRASHSKASSSVAAAATKAAAKTDDIASKSLAGPTAHPVKAASRGDSTGTVGSPSVTGDAQPTLASSKAGKRLPGSKSRSLPSFALPGSTNTASILSRLPSQAGGLLGSLTAGKSGKTAAHRLVIMVLDMIETAEMSKRVDLFYLLDSLLQVSSRESKDGNEAKLEACKTFSRVIAAGLHRVATAMAKDSECISKASKVLDLWQRRQILAKSVLKPALQLLSKMKAEHESADAAAAALRTGQLPLLRRPMRLVMPYASLDSDTGLPTFTVSLPLDQWGSLAGFRFTGLNGQASEFRLKPNWTLPLQEEPEDWDINPATEDLPLDQMLANAAAIRQEHLEELEEQKEAKAHREASPCGDRLDPHADYTAGSPASLGSQQEQDMDMEQGASPDEGATGYYETGQDSAFQFEPPRAPAHYGASRNSPGVSEDPHHAQSYNPWGGSHLWAAGTLGSTWSHMGHTPLQPSQSLYDPFSQTQGHALPHPRLQGLAQDHAFAQAQSQSPEAPPLPAESPPVHDGAPPLPFEELLPPLPPLPPDEDRPPLPPDDAAAPPLPDAESTGETRLATAGLFEPSVSSFVLQQPGQTPPPPLPPTGYGLY